ncbi:MAG TPA: transcription elongation factor GreA [Aestuariivirga sp.]|nr:transcription elongation factor GreA [Aestuariivirga sp.]
MSRAFVKEQDDAPEELLERPVSANPNFVTARGLHLIEEELEGLRKVQAQAQAEDDKAAVARAGRDLRYWQQRRATAQLVAPPAELKAVAFATSVSILREDGRRQRFTIVGEDEADPAKGLIAYVSPMARSLLGKAVGDFAEAPGGEVEIVGLEPG